VKKAKITRDEWMEELDRISQRPSDPGKTQSELASQWGVSHRIAQVRIAKLNSAGSLITGKRYAKDARGHWIAFVVYRLKGRKGATNA
jgi:hypothetical protein